MSYHVGSATQIIGCCFAGHNGIRSSFRYVAVDPGYHLRGIVQQLVEPSLSKLKDYGIVRILVLIVDGNEGTKKFWKALGFRLSSAEGGKVVYMTRDL